MFLSNIVAGIEKEVDFWENLHIQSVSAVMFGSSQIHHVRQENSEIFSHSKCMP